MKHIDIFPEKFSFCLRKSSCGKFLGIKRLQLCLLIVAAGVLCKSFSVWLNNEYIPNNPGKAWIKSLKEIYRGWMYAFTGFFVHQSAFPDFQKKGKSDVKMYFVKNNPEDCKAEIVKTKPFYETIEDLNVSGMMKNRHLSKAVASQKYYESRTWLKAKCDDNGIELRGVDRWYPLSGMCHCCGNIKKDLKLWNVESVEGPVSSILSAIAKAYTMKQ